MLCFRGLEFVSEGYGFSFLAIVGYHDAFGLEVVDYVVDDGSFL